MCRTRVKDFPHTFFRNNSTEYLNALFEACKINGIEWRNFDADTEAKRIADIRQRRGRGDWDVAKDANPIFIYKNDAEKTSALETLTLLGIQYKINEAEKRIEVQGMRQRYIDDCMRITAALLYDFINTIDSNPDFSFDKIAAGILSNAKDQACAQLTVFQIYFTAIPIHISFYNFHNDAFPSQSLRPFLTDYKEKNIEEWIEKYGSDAEQELFVKGILNDGDTHLSFFDYAGLAKFTLEYKAQPEVKSMLSIFNEFSFFTNLPGGLNAIISQYSNQTEQFVGEQFDKDKIALKLSFADLYKLYLEKLSLETYSKDKKEQGKAGPPV